MILNTCKLQSLSWVAGLSLSVAALGFSTASASVSYSGLLQQVEQQQPEKITAAGIAAVQAANQSLSKSWLAGDVYLKLQHETDSFTGAQDSQTWAVGAEFPVWLPSHKTALEGLTSSYQQQASVQSAYLSWLASGKLRQLAWEYKKASISAASTESALNQSLALQDKVQKKVEFGESPALDLLLSQKTVLKQQANLAQAQSRLNIIKAQFKLWTQSSELPESIMEIQQAPKPLERHPKITWLQSYTDISQAKLVQEKSLTMAAPSLYLGAQNDKTPSGDNTALVLSVSIPLGLTSSNRVQIAEQQQAVLAQKTELATAQFELKQALIAAQQRVRRQQQNVHFAQQQSALDQKALGLAEQAYQLGATPIQDLLLIQKQALESQLNLELGHANLGESIAQYNQLMGYSLTESTLSNSNTASTSQGVK